MALTKPLSNFLINPSFLKNLRKKKNLKIIDCRWYLEDPNRGKIEFEKTHIDNAIFFDVEKLCDHTSDLPHMLPKIKHFTEYVRKHNLNIKDEIIIYDQVGFFSSARAWFCFKYFGYLNVKILNGGYQAWIRQKNYNKNNISKKDTSKFSTKIKADPQLVINKINIQINLKKKKCQIIDARPIKRFLGLVSEPRPSLNRGNIDSSINIPFVDIVKRNGYLKNLINLKKLIIKKNLKKEDLIICYCGSGITACNIFFVLSILGFKKIKLYDGSWAEWGKKI